MPGQKKYLDKGNNIKTECFFVVVGAELKTRNASVVPTPSYNVRFGITARHHYIPNVPLTG